MAGERIGLGKVHEADGAPSHLVLIGGADAALGGADPRAGIRGFARGVELAMQGKDERQLSAMRRISGVILMPCFSSRSISSTSACGSSTTPLPMTESLPAHNARREERELIRRAVDDQRMAGVVAALKAHDDIGLLGEPVDDLALAFVTPLGADDDHIGHEASFFPG